jgi:glyoxylase-like metal-dependent hydrolase (beta-lactamase superfamily II)
MFKILTLLNGPIEENCHVIHQEGSAQAVVIDPGSSPDQLKAALDAAGLKPVLLLATHGHFDHVGAVDALAKAYGAPFYCPGADLEMLEALEDTFLFYGMGPTKKPSVDRELKGGEILDASGIRLEVIPTPGHTPGGVCYYHRESGSLFSGDTLFAGSVGRSDFPGGDHEQLIVGIKARLLSLPDDTKVYPGHGEATSIGHEKLKNRFLV